MSLRDMMSGAKQVLILFGTMVFFLGMFKIVESSDMVGVGDDLQR